MLTSIRQIVATVEAMEAEIGHGISRHNYETEIREGWIREVLHELDPQGLQLTHDDQVALRDADTKVEIKAILVKRYPDFNQRATDEIIQGLRWDSESTVGAWGYEAQVKKFGAGLTQAWIDGVTKKGLIVNSSHEGDRVSYNMRDAAQRAGKFLNRVAGLGTFDCWNTINSVQTFEELASAFGNLYSTGGAKVTVKVFKNGKIKIQLPAAAAVTVATAIAKYIEKRNAINNRVEA